MFIQRGRIEGNSATITLDTPVPVGKSFAITSSIINSNFDDWKLSGSQAILQNIVDNNYTEVYIDVAGRGYDIIVDWQIISGDEFNVQIVTFSEDDNGSRNATINQVDLDKTFLTFGAIKGSQFVSWTASQFFVEVKLVDSTTVNFSKIGTNNEMSGVVYIVEWNESNIQSNELVLSSDSTVIDESISTVDLNTSFLIYSWKTNYGGTQSSHAMIEGKFTSSNNIRFQRYGSTSDITINYFVVSSNKIRTQSNTLSASGTTASDTIESVDLDKTFIPINYIGTGRVDTTSNFLSAFNSQFFTDSTTINLIRDNDTETLNSTYFIVEESHVQVTDIYAVNITKNSVTLNADIIANESIDVFFQYKKVSNSTWINTTTQTISSDDTVSENLTNLDELDNYEFRVDVNSGDLVSDAVSFYPSDLTREVEDDSEWNDYAEMDGLEVVDGSLVITDETNYALEFDGNDDYVLTNLGSVVDYFYTGSQKWSCSIKFKPDGTDGVICGSAGGIGGATTFAIYMSGNDLNCRIRGTSSDNLIKSSLSTSDYHVVTVVWDGTDVLAYYENDSPVIIGNGTSNNQEYNYGIADCTEGSLSNYDRFGGLVEWSLVYSRDLSSSEINDLHNDYIVNETDLEGWWKLNDGSGSMAVDETGNNNGTITGATWVLLNENTSTSGYRISNALDLSTLEVFKDSLIVWDGTDLTGVKVYTQIKDNDTPPTRDDSNWVEVTSSESIPDVVESESATGKYYFTKIEMDEDDFQ